MCFHPTESHQIVIKEDKRVQIQTSMMIQINSMIWKDLKRSRMISNTDSAVNHATNKKSKLKGGSMHEIGEINDENSDEILHTNKF